MFSQDTGKDTHIKPMFCWVIDCSRIWLMISLVVKKQDLCECFFWNMRSVTGMTSLVVLMGSCLSFEIGACITSFIISSQFPLVCEVPARDVSVGYNKKSLKTEDYVWTKEDGITMWNSLTRFFKYELKLGGTVHQLLVFGSESCPSFATSLSERRFAVSCTAFISEQLVI